MRRKLEQQQGLLDEPAELEESDFLESIARTIFRKGGGLLGELLNPAETGLDEGYLDDQGRLVVTEPLVRERNFRNWFGDSGMVDEEGEPLVMYHGTNTDFPAFDGDQMIWGSRGKELPSDFSFLAQNFAGGAANMMPIYMKGKSMFDADRIPKTTSIQDYVTELLEQSIERGREFTAEEEDQIANLEKTLADSAATQGYEYAPNYPRFHFWNYPELTFGDAGKDALRKLYEILGFDGIKMTEHGEETRGVFDPRNVKSIHNRGTYNPDDPDLLGMNTMNMSLLYG